MLNPAPTDVVDQATVIEVTTDTCDACPTIAHVKAFVFIRMPSGRSISMCAHHGARHRDALLNQDAIIIDLSHMVGS